MGEQKTKKKPFGLTYSYFGWTVIFSACFVYFFYFLTTTGILLYNIIKGRNLSEPSKFVQIVNRFLDHLSKKNVLFCKSPSICPQDYSSLILVLRIMLLTKKTNTSNWTSLFPTFNETLELDKFVETHITGKKDEKLEVFFDILNFFYLQYFEDQKHNKTVLSAQEAIFSTSSKRDDTEKKLAKFFAFTQVQLFPVESQKGIDWYLDFYSEVQTKIKVLKTCTIGTVTSLDLELRRHENMLWGMVNSNNFLIVRKRNGRRFWDTFLTEKEVFRLETDSDTLPKSVQFNCKSEEKSQQGFRKCTQLVNTFSFKNKDGFLVIYMKNEIKRAILPTNEKWKKTGASFEDNIENGSFNCDCEKYYKRHNTKTEEYINKHPKNENCFSGKRMHVCDTYFSLFNARLDTDIIKFCIIS